MASRTRGRSRQRRYLKSENNTEFQRVVSFSDGVFAIAMTLLVVTVELPVGVPMDRFTERLEEVVPEVVSFFISFAVIGRYWMVHHQFFGLLKAINNRLITWNLLYLAFIAFLPFPTALIGEYSESPLSVISYALCTGCVSALETKMVVVTMNDDLMNRAMPHDVYRYSLVASLMPVIAFALSIPIALWSTQIAMYTWLLMMIPIGLWGRTKPAGADDYFS